MHLDYRCSLGGLGGYESGMERPARRSADKPWVAHHVRPGPFCFHGLCGLRSPTRTKVGDLAFGSRGFAGFPGHTLVFDDGRLFIRVEYRGVPCVACSHLLGTDIRKTERESGLVRSNPY